MTGKLTRMIFDTADDLNWIQNCVSFERNEYCRRQLEIKLIGFSYCDEFNEFKSF
jgi:hypothetical protein